MSGRTEDGGPLGPAADGTPADLGTDPSAVDGADLPICGTCGTQYAAARTDCPVCQDERQYVDPAGQRWTSLRELRASGMTGRFEEEGPGVLGVGSSPRFAIGQRALLVRTAAGNVLWDCAPYLDGAMVRGIEELGGIACIAISHPHFYSTMAEWARAFDAPVYLHAADRQWVGRPDPRLRFWSGESHRLTDELTLLNPGVHFPGSAVLHWSAGRGALFSGDVLNVGPDHRWVSLMYSYAQHIPERPDRVERAAAFLDRYSFDRIYGAWWGRVVTADGNEVLRRSAARYLSFERATQRPADVS
ncbi:MBL fold metallo-hydrolase [Streptomyces sp. NPDC059874]|uniref:MBL fold metallo-hydrolase n=1 Tax=Streptomyces sp. NPDC059874 TaxID=3346983 RepID=UPI00364F5163